MKKRTVTIIAIIAATLVLSILFIFINIKITPSVSYIEVKLNEEIEYPSINASFFNKDISKNISLTSDVDVSIIGRQELVYTVDMLFFKKATKVVVDVQDVEPPSINLNYGNLVIWEMGKEFVTYGCVATDNYDLDVKIEIDESKLDIHTEGVYTVKYIAEDSSGNIAIKNQEVMISKDLNQAMFLNGDFKVENKLSRQETISNFSQFYQYYFVGDSIIRDMGYHMKIEPERVIANPCLSPSSFDEIGCTYKNEENLTGIYEMISKENPQKIVLSIGLCDVEQGGFTHFFKGYINIINKIRGSNSNVEIVISSILPVGSDELETKPTNSVINIYNYHLSLLAKENGLYFVNVAEALKDDNGIGKIEYYKNDQYHLTDIGEEVYINYMKEHLRK